MAKAHNETLFFFQFPVLETLLSGCRFDQIFHQHLNYFSFNSINHMLNELGCELLDHKIDTNHWGAVIIVFKKSTSKSRRLPGSRLITADAAIEKYRKYHGHGNF